jgi:hypothetical protein
MADGVDASISGEMYGWSNYLDLYGNDISSNTMDNVGIMNADYSYLNLGIYNNTINDSLFGDGVDIDNLSGGYIDLYLSYNTIDGNARDGVSIFNDSGSIYAGGYYSFYANDITNNLGDGIDIDNTGYGYMDMYIYNNLVTGNVMDGVSLTSIYGDYVYFNLGNNTITGNGGEGVDILNDGQGANNPAIYVGIYGNDISGNTRDNVSMLNTDYGTMYAGIYGNDMSGSYFGNGLDVDNTDYAAMYIFVDTNNMGGNMQDNVSVNNADYSSMRLYMGNNSMDNSVTGDGLDIDNTNISGMYMYANFNTMTGNAADGMNVNNDNSYFSTYSPYVPYAFYMNDLSGNYGNGMDINNSGLYSFMYMDIYVNDLSGNQFDNLSISNDDYGLMLMNIVGSDISSSYLGDGVNIQNANDSYGAFYSAGNTVNGNSGNGFTIGNEYQSFMSFYSFMDTVSGNYGDGFNVSNDYASAGGFGSTMFFDVDTATVTGNLGDGFDIRNAGYLYANYSIENSTVTGNYGHGVYGLNDGGTMRLNIYNDTLSGNGLESVHVVNTNGGSTALLNIEGNTGLDEVVVESVGGFGGLNLVMDNNLGVTGGVSIVNDTSAMSVNMSGNDITNAYGNALEILNTSGNVSSIYMDGNTLHDSAGYGLFIMNNDASLGWGGSTWISNTDIYGNALGGVGIDNTNYSSFYLQTYAMNVYGNTGNGLTLYNNGGSNAWLTSGSGYVGGNTGNGFEVYNTNQYFSDTRFILDNMTVYNNGADGFDLTNINGTASLQLWAGTSVDGNSAYGVDVTNDDNSWFAFQTTGASVSNNYLDNLNIENTYYSEARLFTDVGANYFDNSTTGSGIVVDNNNSYAYMALGGNVDNNANGDGVRINNGYGGYSRMYFYGTAYNNGDDGLYLNNNNSSGIYVSVDGATVTGSGDDGIDIRSDNSYLSTYMGGNYVAGNGSRGVAISAYNGSFTDALFYGNTLDSNFASNLSVLNGATSSMYLDLTGNYMTNSTLSHGALISNFDDYLMLTIDSNTFTGNTGIGLDLNNYTGTVVAAYGYGLTNNTITGNGSNGMSIANGTGNVYMDMYNTNVYGNVLDNVGVLNYGGMVDLSVSGYGATNFGGSVLGDGLDVNSKLGGNTTIYLDYVTLDGNAGDGVNIYHTGGGTFDFDLIGPGASSSNNGDDGIYAYNGAGSTMYFDVSYATLSGNTGEEFRFNNYGIAALGMYNGTVTENGVGIDAASLLNSGAGASLTATIDYMNIYSQYFNALDITNTNSAAMNLTIANSRFDGSIRGVDISNLTNATLNAGIYSNYMANNYLWGLNVSNINAQSYLTLTDNLVVNNGDSGLRLDNTGGTLDADIFHNQITGNGLDGVYLRTNGGLMTADMGVLANGTGNNSVYGNTRYDVNNSMLVPLSAQNNWWGGVVPSLFQFNPIDISNALAADPANWVQTWP